MNIFDALAIATSWRSNPRFRPAPATAKAVAIALADTTQALASVASGQTTHLCHGKCPDALAGFDSRDPECPVCQLLMQIEVSKAADPAPPAPPSGLNAAQIEYLRDVTDARAEIAEYLRRGVAVHIVHQTDVPDAPPYALTVVEKPGFWIGCFSTAAEADAIAQKIGLVVVVPSRM